MRDDKREWAIITCLLGDALEAGHWADENTKEYIRKNMIPNVINDWEVPFEDDFGL